MSKAFVSEDFLSLEKRKVSWVLMSLCSSVVCVVSDIFYQIFDKEKVTRWSVFCARSVRDVHHCFTRFWLDEKSRGVINDLFTYGSFASLVLTCCGNALGVNMTAITVIKTVGAASTIGGVALKVSLKFSAVTF